jgi:hypothetical protein
MVDKTKTSTVAQNELLNAEDNEFNKAVSNIDNNLQKDVYD